MATLVPVRLHPALLKRQSWCEAFEAFEVFLFLRRPASDAIPHGTPVDIMINPAHAHTGRELLVAAPPAMNAKKVMAKPQILDAPRLRGFLSHEAR
ncbi:hypothetical protein [Kineococcus aurantiacus]|uniref:hypothetical protein n=1 Tax=Kineococcus aurantiacus TaxID=37633 RepID=UPI0031E4758C